ncbi:hypothetical protein RFI_21423 [Reticulomyxa filosa]|uniref:Uncharacterized protein n=1 Tax=Reticulomyxa filosa TaxID=46433 RepID=X6MR90_RETFI|nr:hypothetical protein RFI_21423 [Reticulomyxa filosa]|eukprot:ETO15937.1 hypothetical protein RFI_21423 [Reticulomyxa filosa]
MCAQFQCLLPNDANVITFKDSQHHSTIFTYNGCQDHNNDQVNYNHQSNQQSANYYTNKHKTTTTQIANIKTICQIHACPIADYCVTLHFSYFHYVFMFQFKKIKKKKRFVKYVKKTLIVIIIAIYSTLGRPEIVLCSSQGYIRSNGDASTNDGTTDAARVVASSTNFKVDVVDGNDSTFAQDNLVVNVILVLCTTMQLMICHLKGIVLSSNAPDMQYTNRTVIVDCDDIVYNWLVQSLHRSGCHFKQYQFGRQWLNVWSIADLPRRLHILQQQKKARQYYVIDTANWYVQQFLIYVYMYTFFFMRNYPFKANPKNNVLLLCFITYFLKKTDNDDTNNDKQNRGRNRHRVRKE